MHKRALTWFCLAALAGCALSGLPVSGAEDDKLPKPLPPEVVKAWCDAGAIAGWMKDLPPKPSGGYAFWSPWRKIAEAGAMPAFKFHPEKEDVLAELPDPGVPFGIDFHCSPVKGSWLKKLARFKSLQLLNAGGSLILRDAELEEVAGLTNLRALYLFYSPVTDAGLKHLAGLTKLESLDLSSTRVSDAGLKQLAGLKHLRALNLSRTRVTDAGLKTLAGLKGLLWLDLCGTEATATGVAALQKELPACRIVPAVGGSGCAK